MSDDVDLRNIRYTVARAKKGTRAEREKARQELRWMQKDFPQYFHNGYFREPAPALAIAMPPIEQDEDWLIRQLCDADDAGLQAIEDAREWPNGKLVVNAYHARALRFLFDQANQFAPAFLNEIGLHARRMLLERGDETRGRIAEARRDPAMEEFMKAVPFIDEFDRGQACWKPSELILCHYFMMTSRADVLADPARKTDAKRLLTLRLDEARRRYKAGFYANPLGERVRRPAA